MRIRNELLKAGLVALLAVACGNGGGSSQPADGNTGGTASGGGGSGGSGGATTGSGGGTDSGGSGGGGSGGGGSGGATTVTVAGTVVVVDTKTPVDGATVTVYGSSLSTTSDASGDFTLKDVPRGDVFFAASADGYWGTIDLYSVPGETSGGIEIELGTEEMIDGLGEALGREIDAADAVIDVVWDGASGGETANLDADADDPFTFDADELPVVQDGVLADESGYADLVFSGVDPGDSPIGVTVMGTDGETDCWLDAAPGTKVPAVAKSISFIYAACEPVP